MQINAFSPDRRRPLCVRRRFCYDFFCLRICLARGGQGPSTRATSSFWFAPGARFHSFLMRLASLNAVRRRHQFLFLWYSNCVRPAFLWLRNSSVARAKANPYAQTGYAAPEKDFSNERKSICVKTAFAGVSNFRCGETNLFKRWEHFHFYNCHKLISKGN